MKEATWTQKYINEFIGTYLLVFFGNAGIVVAVVCGGYGPSLWDVSIVFGLGVAMAIYASAAVSGAHINPAATFAFAMHRGFPWSKVFPYIVSQVLGGFCAAATYYAGYIYYFARFEEQSGIIRGQAGSQVSAIPFYCFTPHPIMGGTTPADFALVPLPIGFMAEVVATAVLVYFIFSLFDSKNPASPRANNGALMLGIVVALLVAIEAPLTMACLNPARDFGPRLFCSLAGWGNIAIPGPRGEFWLFWLAPILGGIIGGWIHDRFHRNYIPGYFDEDGDKVENAG